MHIYIHICVCVCILHQCKKLKLQFCITYKGFYQYKIMAIQHFKSKLNILSLFVYFCTITISSLFLSTPSPLHKNEG